jgi:hypothetical protein
MARGVTDTEEIGSQPTKAKRDTVRVEKGRREEERRFQDALEDDEVRAVLKLSPRKKRLACEGF